MIYNTLYHAIQGMYLGYQENMGGLAAQAAWISAIALFFLLLGVLYFRKSKQVTRKGEFPGRA